VTPWLASSSVVGDFHLAEGSLACGSPQALRHSSPGVISNEVVDGTLDIIPAFGLVPAVTAP